MNIMTILWGLYFAFFPVVVWFGIRDGDDIGVLITAYLILIGFPFFVLDSVIRLIN